MLKFANVATPLAAATMVVPRSAPPLELAASASVTSPANPVATLPSASNAVTWTGGVSTLSTSAPCGGAVNLRRAAAAVCATAIIAKLAGAGAMDTYPRLHFSLGAREAVVVAVLLAAAALPLSGRRARLGVARA